MDHFSGFGDRGCDWGGWVLAGEKEPMKWLMVI